jgi:hypothetical protein
MAQGDVSNTVQSGGGSAGASASEQARTIIGLGVCTAGTANTLYNAASQAAINSGLGLGPLMEYGAKILQHYPAGAVYLCPLSPTAAGAVQASVAHTGTGLATITPSLVPHVSIIAKCSTGGAYATAKFIFSLDGGTMWTEPVTSTASPYAVRVPGTFCTLTFTSAGGTPAFTAADQFTVGVDGTVTAGGSNVTTSTCAQVSSPIDGYNVKATVVTGSALGTAVLSVSLDGGLTTLPNMMVPSSGLVVVPNTGMLLTCSVGSGNFVAGDTYSFVTAPPGHSSTEVTNALNALMADNTTPTVALIHLTSLPSSASSAVSLAASTIETLLATAAATYGKQWQAMVECPSKIAGDVVVSAGNAIVDTADTDAVIRAARVGVEAKHVAVCVGTQEMPSAAGGPSLRRPIGWGIAARYVEADPSEDVAHVGAGALDFILPSGALHRNEWSSATTLYDAQFNVLKTYPGRGAGAYLTLEQGGTGWRNLTTDASFQDAGAVRVLMFFLAALTQMALKYLGSRQATNPDGTIAESSRQPISADADGVARRTVGLLAGGPFTERQASSASATCLATSQLGIAPKRLDFQYTLQPLGQVTSAKATTLFSGVLRVQGA